MSLDYLQECIDKRINPRENRFFHSDIYYVKALLQAQFPTIKLTLEETRELLDKEFRYTERDMMGKHPGFKAVAGKIEKEGYSPKVAGAILASKTREASSVAKKANPKLKKVKG